MTVLVQDALVTLAAIVAASIVVRRVFTTVRPVSGAAPKCASCPSAQTHGERRAAPTASQLDGDSQPLIGPEADAALTVWVAGPSYGAGASKI